MDEAECREFIAHGREERNLEYKQSMNWNWSQAATKGKVTKSILAMSNIRDGGVIVIGVEQKRDEVNPVGMQDNDIDPFAQDAVASYVANFAAPYVEFSLTKCTVNTNKFYTDRGKRI